MREINQYGLNILKSFEKCRLNAYQDQGGVWTIGYGHTGPEVVEGMTMTQEQCELQLKKDLEKFYHLDHYLTEQVNDNQYSALVCLAYNIGLTALKTSSVIKTINEGENPDKQWMEWRWVKGQLSNGLINRRKAELELYHKLG